MSDNPNAPKISYALYFWEKMFAGSLFSPVLCGTPGRLTYAIASPCSIRVRFIPGIVIVLFLKFMVALFDPDHRRGAYQVGTRVLNCGHFLACDRRSRGPVQRNAQSIS